MAKRPRAKRPKLLLLVGLAAVGFGLWQVVRARSGGTPVLDQGAELAAWAAQQAAAAESIGFKIGGTMPDYQITNATQRRAKATSECDKAISSGLMPPWIRQSCIDGLMVSPTWMPTREEQERIGTRIAPHIWIGLGGLPTTGEGFVARPGRT